MAKRRFELWAESLRELGVLILVFVPLDTIIQLVGAQRGLSFRQWVSVILSGLFGLGLMILGIEVKGK